MTDNHQLPLNVCFCRLTQFLSWSKTSLTLTDYHFCEITADEPSWWKHSCRAAEDIVNSEVNTWSDVMSSARIITLRQMSDRNCVYWWNIWSHQNIRTSPHDVSYRDRKHWRTRYTQFIKFPRTQQPTKLWHCEGVWTETQQHRAPQHKDRVRTFTVQITCPDQNLL